MVFEMQCYRKTLGVILVDKATNQQAFEIIKEDGSL